MAETKPNLANTVRIADKMFATDLEILIQGSTDEIPRLKKLFEVRLMKHSP